MISTPCPRCGYPAPDAACAHCARLAEPSLATPRAGAREELVAGAQALLRGLHFLGATRGTKRWLVPPLVLTTTVFAFLTFGLVELVDGWLAELRAHGAAELAFEPHWLADAVEAVIRSAVVWWFVSLGSFAVAFVAAFLVALWTFSIVYEALCGPFLDVVHARVEQRWFGADPRATLDGERGRTGAWAWLARNLALLGTSAKASLLAAALLVLAFPVQFVPWVGGLCFAVAAGFATAVSLLDIPFSRREWSLRQRLAFVRDHAGAVGTFGLTAGLVFLVPFVGPILCVPAASVGGAWLVCRLDKKGLGLLDRSGAAH